VHQAKRAAPGDALPKGKGSKIELRQLAQVTENLGKKQKGKNVSAAWKSGMRFTSGIELGGGKTSVQFRRFSSSTPTRLADGLGPKRITLRRLAMRPDELGPPFSVSSEIRLTLWLSYLVAPVKHFCNLTTNIAWAD
jgi:hypothetical protein